MLDSNVEAEKREEWIRDKVEEGFDVMLTNGKLVETGLDLMFASTIIQYGIEYSIHTLRQSIRRSWRLGQKYSVKVIFLGYADTLQEKALNLISKKMRAAEMVDGDDLGGLSNFDNTGADFLLELAQEVIKSNQK
jgi:SNF2 family DNA or RNA helicase